MTTQEEKQPPRISLYGHEFGRLAYCVCDWALAVSPTFYHVRPLLLHKHMGAKPKHTLCVHSFCNNTLYMQFPVECSHTRRCSINKTCLYNESL